MAGTQFEKMGFQVEEKESLRIAKLILNILEKVV